MRLDNEIALYQFAQGVSSDAALLDQFSQLDTAKQRKRFVHFYCRICEYKFVDSEIEQALADCSLDATDVLYRYLNLHRLTTGSNVIYIPHSANPPGGTLDKAYRLLLHLFKIAYQRRFAVEKEDPANWRYWDLANPEIVQDIRTSHQALMEDIYNNPSFRSEFACLAKLWYEQYVLTWDEPLEPESAPEPQTKFDFVTYDEMVEESNQGSTVTKSFNAIGTIGHSVTKGLAVRYGLDIDKARILMFDVIDRYLRETYNTEFFGLVIG